MSSHKIPDPFASLRGPTSILENGRQRTTPSARANAGDWLASKLTDSMFGAPSTMVIYLAGLMVAAGFLLRTTPDAFVGQAAAAAVVLTAFRLAVIVVYNRRRTMPADRGHSGFVSVYCVGAWLYSLDIAALTIRTFALGDLPSIAVTVVMFAGYLVGLIMRAAVIRFAVPSLLILFAPLIVAGAFHGQPDSLVIAILLLLLCLACVHYASVARNTIIGQLSAERQLADIVGRDPLTGIANRMGLKRHVDDLRASPTGRLPFSVAALDLDGFKAVNDRYGHGLGDQLLQKVTERIVSVLAGRHELYRLGGDEFLIVYEASLDHAGAKAICEAIADSIRLAFLVDTKRVRVTCSIGLVRSERGVASFDLASKEADAALYRAKRLGRDRVATAQESEAAPIGKSTAYDRASMRGSVAAQAIYE